VRELMTPIPFYATMRAAYGVGMPYRQVDELPGLPYVCIRIPTGGGKDACRLSCCRGCGSRVARADRCVVLWLVPSNAIRDQTLKGVARPAASLPPNARGRVRLCGRSWTFPKRVCFASTLEAETAIIVSTLQAFRVEDPEGRKYTNHPAR